MERKWIPSQAYSNAVSINKLWEASAQTILPEPWTCVDHGWRNTWYLFVKQQLQQLRHLMFLGCGSPQTIPMFFLGATCLAAIGSASTWRFHRGDQGGPRHQKALRHGGRMAFGHDFGTPKCQVPGHSAVVWKECWFNTAWWRSRSGHGAKQCPHDLIWYFWSVTIVAVESQIHLIWRQKHLACLHLTRAYTVSSTRPKASIPTSYWSKNCLVQLTINIYIYNIYIYMTPGKGIGDSIFFLIIRCPHNLITFSLSCPSAEFHVQ